MEAIQTKKLHDLSLRLMSIQRFELPYALKYEDLSVVKNYGDKVSAGMTQFIKELLVVGFSTK